MNTKHFFKGLQHQRVQRAIARAERHTSSDIVVYITQHEAPDALAAAKEIFTKRHLDKAADDDSLLIFLSPPSQTFAVVGGKALHEAVGQQWWEELAHILRQHFRAHYYSEGLEAAIKFAGEALKHHFPGEDTDRSGQDDLIEE